MNMIQSAEHSHWNNFWVWRCKLSQ